MKKLLPAILTFLFTASAFADEPFRIHRYDGFQALPIEKGDWVFVGNSITHMHDWREAFGGDVRIKNRGVSGAVSAEVLANIDEFVYGKPDKVFLSIGVNDLASGIPPEAAAENVEKTINRIKLISPKTRICVSNVHPTTRSTEENRQRFNKLVERICLKKGVRFVKTADVLDSIQTSKDYSFDALHLTAKGYKFWAERIVAADRRMQPAVYAGLEEEKMLETIRSIRKDVSGNSYGMRLSYFSFLPIKDDAIVFIGDEMLHGTELPELLGSSRVVNRGTGWGGYGTSIDFMLKSVPYILHDGAKPAEVYLYCGGGEVQADDNDHFELVTEKYEAMVDKILELSPKTKITLMALIPTLEKERNINKVKPFNDWLAELAKMRGFDFVDTYSPFVLDDVLNPHFSSSYYLNAYGYRKLGELLYKRVGGKAPISEEKLTKHILRMSACRRSN